MKQEKVIETKGNDEILNKTHGVYTNKVENEIFIITYLLQRPNEVVAIKAIAKKNLAKSQNLLGKEIKILKVSTLVINNCLFY